MIYRRAFALVLAVIGVGLLAPAVKAAPVTGAGDLSRTIAERPNPNAPILVHGCHRGWRLAYVPRWGYVAWHRHVGRRCRPVHPRRVYRGRHRPHHNCVRAAGVWVCW